jgi:hypothetical protein
MEVRVLLPELLAVPNGWSLQTPEKRIVLHELARLVTPVVKRTITRASEARGLGSTPGWGTVTYGLAASSRGVAGWMSLGAACWCRQPARVRQRGCGVSPPAGLCYPRGVPASTRPCEGRGPGSIPGEDTWRHVGNVRHEYASGARVAAHRTRNAARVSSSLTAGSVAQKKVSGTFRRPELQHLLRLESSRHLFWARRHP